MANSLVKCALVTFTALTSVIASLPAQALPNVPYRPEDTFTSTAKLNIRLAPCSTTVTGGANKGLTAYYTGETSPSKTCFGRTSKWREVVFVGPNPDGGSESVRGWVADYLLDNVPNVQNSQASGSYVRVTLNSGTLSLRKNSLSGSVIKQIPNGSDVYVNGYKAPVTIGGVKRFPTKVLYIDAAGKKFLGWVDASYLVAYNVYD
jgi:hypothetical protein